jgi:DNA-binding transcriptional LysR family regulator
MLAELERLGTISAVARSLNLAAPGVSMQLATLERELGVKLTERRGRRVIVTPAGRLLSRHGRSIVDMLSVAEMEIAAVREGAIGTYRVAAFPSAASSFVPAAWKGLSEGHGLGVELRLVELEPSQSIPALATGDVELAVAHSYSNMPPVTGAGLVVTEIATERVRLAVNEREWKSEGEPVSLAAFAAHNWILPSREWTCFDMVHRATDLAGFEPRTVAEATDFRVQLALVAAGVGVALIPDLGCTDPPAGVMLLELDAAIYRTIVVVARSASDEDAGLRRIREALAVSAQAILPTIDQRPAA